MQTRLDLSQDFFKNTNKLFIRVVSSVQIPCSQRQNSLKKIGFIKREEKVSNKTNLKNPRKEIY